MSLFEPRQRLILAKPKDSFFDFDTFIGDILGSLDDGVELDATMNITRKQSASITKYAIEGEKSQVSDHVSLQPETITLSAIMYDRSVPIAGVIPVFGEKTVEEKISLLNDWIANGNRLIIYGYRDEEFESVVLKSFSEKRDLKTGIDSRQISLTLQKVVVADSEKKEVKIASKRGRPKRGKKGKTGSSTAEGSSKSVSTLKSLF